MPCVVESWNVDEPADAGERRLAQRDLAGHAGDHDDRAEDDRVDRRLLAFACTQLRLAWKKM